MEYSILSELQSMQKIAKIMDVLIINADNKTNIVIIINSAISYTDIYNWVVDNDFDIDFDACNGTEFIIYKELK